LSDGKANRIGECDGREFILVETMHLAQEDILEQFDTVRKSRSINHYSFCCPIHNSLDSVDSSTLISCDDHRH
jgi:hypothetical protein